MAVDLYTKKMNRLFRALDITDDGYVDRQDFDILVGDRQVVGVNGWRRVPSGDRHVLGHGGAHGQ